MVKIFNWEDNCETVLCNKKYSTKKHQYQEEIVLVKYLQNKKYSKEEIYSIWLSIESNFINSFRNDQEELNTRFNCIWNKSFGCRLLREKYCPINIYKEEINYINSLDCLFWIKKYLLVLLFIYKYYGLEYCEYSMDIRSFLFELIQKRQNEYNKTLLSNYCKKYKLYEIQAFTNKYVTKIYTKVLFNKNNGSLLYTFKEPKEAESIFHELKYFSNVCTKCGTSFEKKEKTKRELCDNCYKIQRQANKNKNYKKK